MTLKILLIDDDDGFRQVTAMALEAEGCSVREATNGLSALACLELETPDLIISDIEMPGIDGVELSQLIRGNPAFARTPLMLLSAHVAPDGAGLDPNHKADTCVSKEVEFRQLFRRILLLLNG